MCDLVFFFVMLVFFSVIVVFFVVILVFFLVILVFFCVFCLFVIGSGHLTVGPTISRLAQHSLAQPGRPGPPRVRGSRHGEILVPPTYLGSTAPPSTSLLPLPSSSGHHRPANEPPTR